MNKNGKLKTVSTPSLANTNHRKKIAELRPSWASSAFFFAQKGSTKHGFFLRQTISRPRGQYLY